MNKVVSCGGKSSDVGEVNIEDITEDNFSNDHSAFIGIMPNYAHKLFLVTYAGISLAEQPLSTWSDCKTYVEKWVDVEIKIIEQN